MITFCLIIFLVVSFYLFIRSLLKFTGITGEGLDGMLLGFWGTIIGLGFTICGVWAIVKLYNIHVTFG